MLKKYILLLITAWTGVMAAFAEKPDFKQLASRADRFIQYKEWASAQAMLQLMADERPDDSAVTGKAIAIAGVRVDSVEQLRLFNNAVKARQPFEKVFNAVETETFSLARGDVYEDFLLMLARHEPWLSRSVDSYLLRYYTYRCNPKGMVTYADRMLSGLPDNVGFLHTKARGLMLEGDFAQAMDIYRRIVEINPSDADALLALGFYARTTGHPEEALSYFRRAYAVLPTPYLAEAIRQLDNPDQVNTTSTDK